MRHPYLFVLLQASTYIILLQTASAPALFDVILNVRVDVILNVRVRSEINGVRVKTRIEDRV
jgi:hypothetical protein